MKLASFMVLATLWLCPLAFAGEPPPTSCGNGMVDIGEDCDASAGAAPDCCVDCHFTTNPCDDGIACTTNDTCSQGKCAGTPDSSLCTDDPGQCRFNYCDTAQGCVQPGKPFGTPCDLDNDLCTLDECSDAVCISTGNTLNCDDQDPCTKDSCVLPRSIGPVCQHEPIDCPTCGNNQLDQGETCDPPGSMQSNGATCRSDCTFCGDGVVQTPETCDDGNQVSGCNPDKPTVPLDACQNDCTRPICGDPAIISLRPVGPDQLEYHGRLVLQDAVDRLDADQNAFVFRLTKPDGTVLYEVTLPAGSLTAGQKGTIFSYRNPQARATQGVSKVLLKYRDGMYGVNLRSYGDMSAAQADMTSHVLIGQKEWTVHGKWRSTPRGWRLSERDTFAP